MSIHIQDYDAIDARAIEYANQVPDDLSANSVAYRLFLIIFNFEESFDYNASTIARSIRRDLRTHRLATKIIYAARDAHVGYQDIVSDNSRSPISTEMLINFTSIVSWIKSVNTKGGGVGLISRNVAYKMVLAYLGLKEPASKEYILYGLGHKEKIDTVCAMIEGSCFWEYRDLRQDYNFCNITEVARIIVKWSKWSKGFPKAKSKPYNDTLVLRRVSWVIPGYSS